MTAFFQSPYKTLAARFALVIVLIVLAGLISGQWIRLDTHGGGHSSGAGCVNASADEKAATGPLAGLPPASTPAVDPDACCMVGQQNGGL